MHNTGWMFSLVASGFVGFVLPIRVAASAASGLMLESPTWRANLDWGRRLGYDEMALARVNRAAVALLRDLAQRWADAVPTILVSGMVGPRGDGYQAEARMGAQESADYPTGRRSMPCPEPIGSAHRAGSWSTAHTLTT